MRTVFTNAKCAHVWAQLSQPHGRSGSMKFDGAVAYSYQTPVANIITPQGRAPVALFVPNRWGVTTASHLREYKSAASHYPQFDVPYIFAHDARVVRDNPPDDSVHSANIGYLTEQYTNARDALMRAPADSWRLRDLTGEAFATQAHETLSELADVLSRYCGAFFIAARTLPWQSDADKAIARRNRIVNDPKRAAKMAAAAERRAAAEVRKLAERAARDAEARAAAADAIARWRNGEDVRLPYAAQRDADGGAMLRLCGDTVQTSLGADAPLSHVRRVLEVLYSKVPRGQSWQRDTRYSDDRQETYSRLGHFRLDSIDADGNVRAGCHFITAAEIAALRAALNV